MEECTVDYIECVKSFYCGKWICEMCIKDALSSHYEVCRDFNKTTRLNPRLSLAITMSDIERRSSQERNNTFTKKIKSSTMLKTARTI
ncbi:hypothetical protein MKX01_035019 [Papaver californicum]|nr:hypothetical protein MKX01_035019 [Papaver californicum]